MEISENLMRYRHCERGVFHRKMPLGNWEGRKKYEDPKPGYFLLFTIYAQRSIELSANIFYRPRRMDTG